MLLTKVDLTKCYVPERSIHSVAQKPKSELKEDLKKNVKGNYYIEVVLTDNTKSNTYAVNVIDDITKFVGI